MEITDYKIVTAEGANELERAVRSELKEGWQPQGGACRTHITGAEGEDVLWGQAMVKLGEGESTKG